MSPVVLINDGLPDPLFRAMQRQQRPFNPDAFAITVTELLAPPRQRQLLRQAELDGTEIRVPTSRLVAAFLGTCVHKGLEPADEDLTRGEERLHAEILVPLGLPLLSRRWKVSGQPDLIDEHGIIHDYKLTKAFALKDGWVGMGTIEDGDDGWDDREVGWCGKVEWIQQLNAYAELARRNGITVQGLRLTAFIKDFRPKGYGKFKSTTEEMPWVTAETCTFHVPLWTSEQATAWLHERLAAHEAAMSDLPRCTDEERWVNERTGQPNRCEGWCSAFAVCSQAQSGRSVARDSAVYARRDAMLANDKPLWED